MKINEMATWEAFVAVATQGGFSKASKVLKAPVPQVSKRISRLENELGTRLFQRTTRVVSLTDEGRTLLPKIQSVLEDLKEAESFFESGQNLSGTVKVTSVPFVAHKLLLPHLDEFMRLHPKIHVDFELSEDFVNLIDAGLDMAIRIETPKDSDLVYKPLAPNDLIFCASPDYLRRNKHSIRTPEDLHQHDLLMLKVHRKCRFKNLSLTLGEFQKSKKLTCENGNFLTDMALKGHGILIRSIWDVEDHLEKGLLKQVLTSYPLETFGYIHAVVPSKRFLAPRVRAFLDFILLKSKAWN